MSARTTSSGSRTVTVASDRSHALTFCHKKAIIPVCKLGWWPFARSGSNARWRQEYSLNESPKAVTSGTCYLSHLANGLGDALLGDRAVGFFAGGGGRNGLRAGHLDGCDP